MPGLPPDLYTQCRTILLQCHEFENHRALRAVFVTDQLFPFRIGLPSADNPAELVDRCLEYLLGKRLTGRRPVLPVFLATLRDRYEQGDALRDELGALAEAVQSALVSSESLSTTLRARQIAPRQPPRTITQLHLADLHFREPRAHDENIVFDVQRPFSSLMIDDPALAGQHLGVLNQPVPFPSYVTEQANIPADIVNTLPPLTNPALWVEDNFVGRERIIQELVAAVDTARMIVILGIPGVGKTALMAQIASCLDPSQVFGYSFRPGLASLGDVLMNLARFLDNQSGCRGILADVLWASRFSGRAQIDLIIEGLNAGCYYLFFDSAHHITGDPALNSLLALLKEQLRQGTAFVASRSKPDFYTPLDEKKQLVKPVELEGLHEPEIVEFFDRKSISLAPEVAEALDTHFGALPLALELMTPLLAETSSETELLVIADQIEEQVIDYLFTELYEQLDPAARDLLTTASLLIFPFSRNRLLDAHRAIFGQDGGQANFLKLRKQLLIQQFATDLYQVHEVIGALALKHADQPSQRQTQLADHLAAQAPDELESQLEAILLYYRAEAYDQAAELAVSVVDLGMLEYDPDLAETILSGFRKEMVSPEQWVWLVGSRGNLACSRRQHDEAEDHYRTMLQLAEELGDKAGAAIAFQRLGTLYLDRDDKVAERYYHDSLDLKKELNDSEGQAGIYNNLGALYINQGQFVEARSVLQKGLDLLESIRAPEWQKLSLYGNLGYLHAEQGQWEDANRFTEKARRIAEEIGSPCELAKSTYNLGIHEAWQGNRETACERYLEALEIAEACGCWEIEELAQIALGKQYHELGNYDQAVACFQRVAEIRKSLEDKSGLVGITFDIGTFYYHKGDLQKALDYYEDGIVLFEHLSDEEQVRLYLTNIYGIAAQSAEPRRLLQSLKRLKNRLLASSPSYMLAKVYGTLGDIYLWLLHRERVALACMRQEVALLDQLDRRQDVVEALMDLGVVYEDLEYYGDALDKNAEAIELAERHGLPRQAGITYYNRANCFTKLEMWQQAEDDYRRSLAIAEEIEDTQLREAVHHNLGEVYRRWGRLDDAVELLRSSLVSARQRGDIEDEVRTLNNLGLAYHALSQDHEALDCFHDALELGRQYGLKHDESNVLISLGNFHLEGGLPEKAKDCYEQALAAARAAEDIYMEEGSVLSLAYAHHQLGTFDDIAEDFKTVAERADALKYYENLLQFLTLAGEINLEEGEAEAAAEMFEQALIIAAWIGYDRMQQLESRIEIDFHFSEFFGVIARICILVDKALQDNAIERAQALYESLTDDLQHSEFWGEDSSWVADFFRPIEDYLAKRPEQSAWEFLASAWAEKSDSEPE